MMRGAAVRRGFFLLALALAAGLVAGCDPAALVGPQDEARETHFRRAEALVRDRQYTRAAEALDRALEVNPRSAAAHLLYARLCREHLQRPDQAIFHYQRYLALRPDEPNAATFRGYIEDCRRQLAGPVAVTVIHQELVNLVRTREVEKTNLLRQLEQLRHLYQQATNDFARRSALSARIQPAHAAEAPPTAAAAVAPAPAPAASAPPPRILPGPDAARAAAPRPANPPPARAMQVHYVRSGDTVTAIARRYGTTPSAIVGANPGLNPNRLRVGQALNIPR